MLVPAFRQLSSARRVKSTSGASWLLNACTVRCTFHVVLTPFIVSNRGMLNLVSAKRFASRASIPASQRGSENVHTVVSRLPRLMWRQCICNEQPGAIDIEHNPRFYSTFIFLRV